jgi:hypothetical protein
MLVHCAEPWEPRGGPGRLSARYFDGGVLLRDEITFANVSGKSIHGNYEIADGIITVTTATGLSKTADVDQSMLSPETLAKMLLLQLYQQENADP